MILLQVLQRSTATIAIQTSRGRSVRVRVNSTTAKTIYHMYVIHRTSWKRRMERKSILIRRVAEERIFALGRSASTTGAMYIAAIQTLVIRRCFLMRIT